MKRIIGGIALIVIVSMHIFSIIHTYNALKELRILEEVKTLNVQENRRVKLLLLEEVELKKEYEMYLSNEGDFIYYPAAPPKSSDAVFSVENESDKYCSVMIDKFDSDDVVKFRPSKDVNARHLEYEVDKSLLIGKQARIGFNGIGGVSLIEFSSSQVNRYIDNSEQALITTFPLILSLFGLIGTMIWSK